MSAPDRTPNPPRAVVLYESADDVLSKAPLHYRDHRARVDEFHARGALLMIGPFGDPATQGSMAVFASRGDAQEFVDGDPFVLQGVVRSYDIRDWQEILSPP
jgi:uncharacterized protein YciI